MFAGREIERLSEQEGGTVFFFCCFGGDKREQTVSAVGLFGESNRVQISLADLYDGSKSVQEVLDVGFCGGRKVGRIGLEDG